jgi:hypothetical protein
MCEKPTRTNEKPNRVDAASTEADVGDGWHVAAGPGHGMVLRLTSANPEAARKMDDLRGHLSTSARP